MIINKKIFAKGLISIVLFFVVLFIFFSPVFNGHNGLEYLDDLYNSISKGSAYYIPKVMSEAQKFNGDNINITINMGETQIAEQTAQLFEKSGAVVAVNDAALNVSGDLGKILGNCIEDSDLMYKNEGEKVSEKYGYNERQALYNWWMAFRQMDKDLKRQEKFSEAEMVNLIKEKAVETSYNYYKIEPQKISEKLWFVIFSLIFYVFYTLWYGYAIMYLFEGWGLQLENH
ncbi:MAG: hypothetical protein JXL81_06125 [Deltaproteobacteria bacterium]|nr:hypothetical protein [Deltaproteobacteria bacterium]